MKELDVFSYACGVMDCFNEMIVAGLKPIALMRPLATLAEMQELLPAAEEICKKYGTHYYEELDVLVCDLFPLSMVKNQYTILFYKQEETLEKYLALKAQKIVFDGVGQYTAQKRNEIAKGFGALLGYPQEDVLRMITQNSEKEA